MNSFAYTILYVFEILIKDLCRLMFTNNMIIKRLHSNWD